MSKVYLKDIALEANVSMATVSRVLNKGDDKIASPEVASSIREIAKRLGYNAKEVQDPFNFEKTKNTIGVILGSEREDKYGHSYYGRIYDVIEKSALDYGYGIDFYYTNDEIRNVPGVYDRIVSSNAKGIILIDGIDEGFKDLYAVFNNLVSINLFDINFMPCDIVNVSVYDTLYNTLVEIIGNSGTEVAYISGAINQTYKTNLEIEKQEIFSNKSIDKRNKSYKDALAHFNMEIDFNNILIGGWDYNLAYIETGKLLDRNPNINFIFAADDTMALGALKAINERGIKIPNKISLLGFDDLSMSQYSTPQLSTIHIPRGDLAKTAVSLLMLRISGKLGKNITATLEPWYVKRETTI